MIERDVEVWLFHPASGGPSSQAKRFIQTECRNRGWKLTLRPTTVRKSPEGRPLGLIKSQDAINLYGRIHRSRIGVWQIGYAHAPRKPRPRPIVGDYIELHRFISHKAFHHKISKNDISGQWLSSLPSFSKWLEQVCCEGEGDPRCLPLHVFSTKYKIPALATQVGRSAFAQVHGPQSSRVDNNKLHWNRPKGAYHGQEMLHVAGHDLAPGFHWDVLNPKGRRHITTTKDIWEIGPNGYVNVSPDQHIRKGRWAKRRR